MHFNHLGLPVGDDRRSLQFYLAYFGFDPATAQQYPDGTVIIRNADGFDLALHPVEHIEPQPAFLHAGFKAAGPADVRTLMGRMEADSITIAEWEDEAGYTGVQVPRPGRTPDRGVLGATVVPIARNPEAAPSRECGNPRPALSAACE